MIAKWKSDESRITASEIKFMLRTAGCTKWVCKKNEDILEGMTKAFTTSVMIFIEQFQARWPWYMGMLESWLSMSSSSEVPAQHYYPRLHREAIEIYKHRNNFNKKEEGLKIHKSWYLALKMCKVKPPITKSSDIETDQSGISCPSAGQSRSSSTHAPHI